MKIRCAWCKRITGNKPPYGGKYDDEVTDGICKTCEIKYFGGLYNDGRQIKETEENQVPYKPEEQPAISSSD